MSNSNTRKTLQQVLLDFKSLHGDRYNYSKYIYINSRTKGIVICKLHGEFSMTYDHHFHRGQNCPNCAPNKKQNTEKCVSIFKSVHGDRYDYSLVKYIGNRNRVKIICKKHGIFEQEPLSHKQGRNCPACAIDESCCDFDKLIFACNIAHNNAYVYDRSSYKNASSKMKITCSEHGDFWQRASQHRAGRGCKDCTMVSGWGRSNYITASKKHGGMSKLYVCKMSRDNETFYKVGISFTGYSGRFGGAVKRTYKMSLVRELTGEVDFIWNLEKTLHRKLKPLRHTPSIHFVGSTECFSDIPKSILKFIDKLKSTDQIQLIT